MSKNIVQSSSVASYAFSNHGSLNIFPSILILLNRKQIDEYEEFSTRIEKEFFHQVQASFETEFENYREKQKQFNKDSVTYYAQLNRHLAASK